MAVRLLTFNTKDFFPPGGPVTPALFRAKVDAVAQMLLAAQADIVGLQEVGPDASLDALAARLKRELPYPHVLVAPPDKRGIRNAVLSRLPFDMASVWAPATLPFPVFVTGDPAPFDGRIPLRRPVLHVRVSAPDIGPVHVVVGHFKSKLPAPLRRPSGEVVPAKSAGDYSAGLVRSFVLRSAEALFLRTQVDVLLAEDPAAHVAVMGDFNDEPGSLTLDVLCGEGPGRLYAAADLVPPAARFSLIHQGRGMQLDHVLLTEPLRRRLTRARFFNETLRDHGPYAAPMSGSSLGSAANSESGSSAGGQGASSAGAAAPTVDSDHAPFLADFV